jgi:hypothetical protein
MNQNEHLASQFNKLQQRSMIAGVAGIILLAVGALMARADFFQSYLYGYLIWMWLTLGCLGVLLLHHLVSGSWGHIIQRYVEAGAKNLPLMLVLFLPILLGMNTLYPWLHPHETIDHAYIHAVEKKLGYLNVPFFMLRQGIFFALWIAFALWLTKKSQEQDKTGNVLLTRSMKIFSGPATVLFVLTATFASVDWMMSLEPEWYSTMYGIGRIVGALLTTIAFCILLVRFFGDHEPLKRIITTRHVHHLGNLMFAFTIVWAYIAFSEFLIIWSGNLPEDNMWHLRRMGTEWNAFAVILILGHFLVPFLFLLSRQMKRHIEPLARLAVGILVMRLIDMYWLVFPAFNNHEFKFHWLSIIAPIAIGGIWLWMFFYQLKKQPLLPLNDPRFHNGMAEQH